MASVAHFTRRLASEFDLLSPLADEISAFLDAHVADEDLAYQALLLSSEAVTNGMEHGNQLDPAKFVNLRIDVQPGVVVICVEDEGDGFDPAAAPDAVSEDDPLAERHRGLFLMRTYAHDLRFENGGRRIVLTLHGG